MMQLADDTRHRLPPSGAEIIATLAGAQASLDGKTLFENPYTQDSNLGCAWRCGWQRPTMYLGARP